MRRSSVMLERHGLVYSKGHPPKVGAIPPAEIGVTPLL